MRADRWAMWVVWCAAWFACGDDDAGRVDAGQDAGAIDAGTDAPADAFRPDAGPPPPPVSEPGRHDVSLVTSRQVIPGPGLPPETPPMASNNNLDAVRFEGHTFLAWRTAPDHFAGTETRMHVIRSEDEETWTHEATFFLGTDVREPRFLVLDGTLHFYFSVLGTERLSFDPMGIRHTERAEDGTWSEPETLSELDGYVVWRTKVERDGVAYMTAYEGGEHIYRFDGMPLHVELRTSTDAVTWTPVRPAARPDETFVYRGGGSESDFALGDDGTLYAVIRNEAGDERGWGSMVCRAESDDRGDWDCRIDPKKYDSPRMFWFDGEAYLIARRNVTDTGHYDLMWDDERGMTWDTIRNQSFYSGARKRCALWRYVQDEQRIAYVMDLPSRGDTCFAAQLDEGDGTIVVYDYSNDPEGPDRMWSEGQRGETNIYRHVLRFAPR